MTPQRDPGFWSLHIPGWLLLVYLVYAQAIPAFDYDLGVRMGTQESAEITTEVGTAFWYGFALGDLLIYIPPLTGGLIGHARGTRWGDTMMTAALDITVYWPIVSLVSVVKAQGAPGWHLTDISAYCVVLSVITAWAVWGLWHQARAR